MQLQEPETTRLFVAAERAARRIHRKRAEPWLDPEDVRQDLLVDLLARLKGYDPERGCLTTFASICFHHRAAGLRCRGRRDRHRRQTVSIETPVSDKPNLTLSDTLAETDGYSARMGFANDVLARTERLLDLDRALSSLPDEAISLCALLLLDQPDPVSASGLPRTTFYRRLSDLRCHLLAAGITAPHKSRTRGQ